MITSLRGQVVSRGENHVVVDVGGVGFKVWVPPQTAAGFETGQSAHLFTHLHVRENELALYGFRSSDELHLFELLLGVTGIGPKMGLKVVSLLSAQALSDAISRGDVAALTRIPGIGKRTAERVVVELKGKLGLSLESSAYPALTTGDTEVIAALTSLGYSVNEAQAALQSLPPGDLPVEERIRLSLQYFARE
ncbi:MAG: Holliday junction ATP-dependent DNA helicase RuvA [Chloroflexi bacterium ADurb.Bin180]|nr:MAG: Holliday junction ATP-dependent DNA helicase RuvA [Chloroflexi bacterium ADurb.Bin180]HNR96805.1 Holliday junction branch migration protein RuvA [Anaerolineae bacterium]HNT05890.1 Holliday junction branch migration protein RuvA [Anaerolineae bacterium]